MGGWEIGSGLDALYAFAIRMRGQDRDSWPHETSTTAKQPTFDNQIATLRFDGRQASVLI